MMLPVLLTTGPAMRHQRPVKLDEIIGESRFGAVSRRNELRAAHGILWQQVVAEPLRSCCRLIVMREGVLTIATDHATTASQLRYLQRVLIQQLQAHAEFSGLQRLRIIVSPAAVPAQKKQAKDLPTLSLNTSNHLLQTADCLGNSELSAILRRLASRRRRGGQ